MGEVNGAMEYLMDTHVALWWWADDPQLSKTCRDLISDSTNAIYFSSISGYEIIMKHRLGKLQLPPQLANHLGREVATEGWVERGVNLATCVLAAGFVTPHRDPFDRILAAQAIDGDLPLLSIDSALDGFGVNRIW